MLSGRWRSSIVCALLDAEAIRFMELQRRVTRKAGRSIARKVLVEELGELAALGIVVRTVGPTTKPPFEIDYRLTPWGRELAPVVEALMAWVTADASGRARRSGVARVGRSGS
jgi:DNA-binding HxlR family transcriptional regulator